MESALIPDEMDSPLSLSLSKLVEEDIGCLCDYTALTDLGHICVIEIEPLVVQRVLGKGSIVPATETSEVIGNTIQVVDEFPLLTRFVLHVLDYIWGHVEPVHREVHHIAELARAKHGVPRM